MQYSLWMWQIIDAGREDLDRTGFEFGYLGLGIQGVVRQQIGCSLSKVERNEDHAHSGLL